MARSILDVPLKDFESKLIAEAEKIGRKANKVASKEMEQIVKSTYSSIIEQFYEYKTTSYIRHWETEPGTGKGSNLYYADETRLHNGILNAVISSDGMADYPKYSDSKSVVLYQIFRQGIRHPSMPDVFEANVVVQSKKRQQRYIGTPNQIMSAVFQDVRERYFYDSFFSAFRTEANFGNYKYFGRRR